MTGAAILGGRPFHRPDTPPAEQEAAADARLLLEYMRGFEAFYGDGRSAARQYWALLAWLYAARSPTATLPPKLLGRKPGEDDLTSLAPSLFAKTPTSCREWSRWQTQVWSYNADGRR
jgi:hypothetical protein